MCAVKDDQSVVDREPDQEESLEPRAAHGSDARTAAGRPARKTAGLVPVVMSGTLSIPGGVCPACLHQWTETQCLSCSRWAAHSDWYEHS